MSSDLVFDPSKLSRPSSPRQSAKPRAERIIGKVVSYEMPADNYHFAIVERLDQPGRMARVRLNTVNERIADAPTSDPDKIKAQYVSGANTRESLADKAKAGITLISFDDARFIGMKDGVPEFRAHWPTTISASPDAEVMIATAHFSASSGDNAGRGRVCRVDVVKKAEYLSKENALAKVEEAFALKDDQGRARDPFIVLRALLDGQPRFNPRIYPAREEATKFDQSAGAHVKIQVKASAEQTMAALMEGKPSKSDTTTLNEDIARVMLSALSGAEFPVVNRFDIEKAKALYAGIATGAMQVELASMEQIDAGPDTASTLLKRISNNVAPQLKGYNMVKESEKGATLVSAYTKTVIGIQRHPDGEPYMVHVNPVAMSPRFYTMAQLYLQPKVEATAELTAEAANEAVQQAPVDAPAPDVRAEPEQAQLLVEGSEVQSDDDYMP